MGYENITQAENSSAMQNSNAVIEISNLTKKYGSKKAVDDISFTVNRGEVLGFLGPNGAGKSTTMNILTGYISSTSGKTMVDGIDVLENPKAVKSKIGYLPENPPLYLDMTVREYLDFVYELKKVKLPRTNHLARVMDTVKIFDVADRMIKNLSKGYKQRVGLAQALIGDPEVLILDEPTVGLDPKQIIEIRDVIKTLGKTHTIILSTHILQEVNAVCDRVAIINQGKLAAMGSLQELSQTFGDKGKYLIRAVGSRVAVRNLLESIAEIVKIQPAGAEESGAVDFCIEFAEGTDPRKKIFEAFAKATLPIIEFKSLELTLEEIFLRVISAPVLETEAESDQGEAVLAEESEEKEEPDNESDI